MSASADANQQAILRQESAGAALITALMIVALATMTIVSLSWDQRVEIQRTTHLLNRDRAYLTALGGEAWARGILARDWKETRWDSLDEGWARSMERPIALAHGEVSGRIIDLQARFNLNNLAPGGHLSPLDAGRFQRLLDHLGLDPDLMYAVADWLDPDSSWSGPGGAEDPDYLGGRPPYRTPGRNMASLSELLLIRGIDQKVYQTLLPFVTVLPAYADINVNTAPAEVLRILADDINMEMAARLVERRVRAPFESVQDFVDEDLLDGLYIPFRGMTVTSQYFLTEVDARIDGGRVRLFSLLARGNRGAQVLMRGQGVL